MKKNKIILSAMIVIVALMFTHCKSKTDTSTNAEEKGADTAQAGSEVKKLLADSTGVAIVNSDFNQVFIDDFQKFQENKGMLKMQALNDYILDVVVLNPNDYDKATFAVSVSFNGTTGPYTDVSNDSPTFLNSGHNGVPWTYNLSVKIRATVSGSEQLNTFQDYVYFVAQHNNCVRAPLSGGAPVTYNRKIEITVIKNEGTTDSYRTNCSMVPDMKN